MQVGAIEALSHRQERGTDAHAQSRRREGLFAGTDSGLTILGNDLTERTISALRRTGVNRPTVLREGLALSELSRGRYATLDNSHLRWEQALAHSVEQGFDLVLLIGTPAYTDLNFDELLRFHMERAASLTQVYAADRALNIAAVSLAGLRNGSASLLNALGALLAKRERFPYRGYVNSLRAPADFVQLIEDSLHQRCGLRPAGLEIANGVWFGDAAEVDDSCVVGAPSFIGANTRIAACCTISGGSAIESACHVDSGTAIERSWILPGTYVGVGLNVRRSIVSKGKMFHLDRKTEITVTDRRLIGATRSLPFFGGGEGLLGRAPVSAE